jgi:hypothetical protein
MKRKEAVMGARGFRRSLVLIVAPVLVALVATSTAAASSPDVVSSPGPSAPPAIIHDSQLRLATTVESGADVLPTTRTIPHWGDATVDPENGTTYRYNIVGANPDTCAGAACDVTVQVDITPVNVRIDGMTFSGEDVLQPLLDSPLFALNDYGSTPLASTGAFAGLTPGPGGVLSQGDAGRPLQFLDAVMRADFGRTGASAYHLRLHPNVLPPVTIDVPRNLSFVAQSERGTIFAGVSAAWWGTRLKNLLTDSDPTHLALFVGDDVLLCDRAGYCHVGYHGGQPVGSIQGVVGSGNSNGNAPVQTFAYASWLSPGIGPAWNEQDIWIPSHELAEWATDPFITNRVDPWQVVPGSPQYGCSPLLESGDAVQTVGFAIGSNTFRQGPEPDGTQIADGFYHPQDVVMLPWFLRLAPNAMSELSQTASQSVGRYTFMGDLNRSPGFDGPAPGC